MPSDKKFTFNTLLLISAICLVMGFIGGVAYGIYYSSKSTLLESGQPDPPSANLDNEISSLQKFTKDHPDVPDGWIRLGNVYFDSDRNPEAIDAYETALKLDPNNANVWTDLGVMYRRSGQPEKAIESFDRAIAADPKHEVSRFNKGIVQMHDLNDTENAIQSWNELLQVNPAATAPGGMPITEVIRQIKTQSSQE